MRFNRKDSAKMIFFEVPKIFIYGSTYKKLDAEAKLLYVHYRDRTKLSMKNNWYDENDDAYFIATDEETAKIFDCDVKKVSKIKKKLMEFKLLELQRMGQGKPNRMYLHDLDVSREDSELLRRFGIIENNEPENEPEAPEPLQTKEFENIKESRKGNIENLDKAIQRIQIRRFDPSSKNNLINNNLSNDDDDKPEQVPAGKLSLIEIAAINDKVKEEYKQHLKDQSINAMCRKVTRIYEKGGIKRDYEEYLRASLDNKIIMLEERRKKEAAAKQQQPAGGRRNGRKEIVPEWVAEQKQQQEAKKEALQQPDLEAERAKLEKELQTLYKK
jgi:hypothetical protein